MKKNSKAALVRYMKMKPVMKLRFFITGLLLMAPLAMSAQLRTGYQTDSVRNAEYRKKIAIDMSVPDFETKKIDGKVMGTHLASLIEFLLENYHQGTYNMQISEMVKEQNEALEKVYFNIKKMEFVSAKKAGNEINIYMKVWPAKNTANVKKADLAIHFKDGIGDNSLVNELFSNISRYVQMREVMNQ